MARKKKATCVNSNGKPRRGYPTEYAAEDGAEYVLENFDLDMVPYKCGSCGAWHLCPAERHTPSHHCEGCGNQAYESLEDAERRADILESERSVWLSIYECPRGEGYHLTSEDQLEGVELLGAPVSDSRLVPTRPLPKS